MKRSVKTLLLLLTLVVLGGGYYALTRLAAQETEVVSETTGNYPLVAKGAQVTALSWTANETDFAFEKQGDAWVNTLAPSFPVDQAALEKLAASLADKSAARKLENVSTLADYGLDAPAFTATATVDGAVIAYQVGDATPFQDGYYFTLGDDSVYILDESITDLFPTELNALAQQEPLPGFESYTRLTAQVGGETVLNQTYADEAWHRTGVENEPGDNDTLNGLVDSLQSLAWDSLVTWQAEDLSAYGLDEASARSLTVYNGAEAVFEVLLGSAQSATGDIYARLPGSQMVYLLDSSAASSLASASDASVRRMTLVALSYEELASLTFDLGSGPVTLVKSAAAETEAGAEATVDSVDTALEALYEALTALNGAGVAKEGTTGEALLTLTLTSDQAAAYALTFRAYDVAYYLADTGAARPLLVDAGAVDKLIRQLKALP